MEHTQMILFTKAMNVPTNYTIIFMCTLHLKWM